MIMLLTADDVLSGIFFYMSHDKQVKKISADREKLHSIFYSMKEKYPQIMEVFTFRNRERFPESPELDQALSNLDAAGLITRQNMKPKYYSIESCLDESYTNFSVKILEDARISLGDVKKVASMVAAEVAAKQ